MFIGEEYRPIDMWIVWIFLGSIVGAFCFIGYVGIPRTRRRILLTLPDLDLEEPCSEIAQQSDCSKEFIIALINDFARFYKVPAPKLHPSLRFREDLCLLPPGMFFDFADRDRLEWAAQKARMESCPVSWVDCLTVGELIGEIASALSAAQNRGEPENGTGSIS